MYVCIYGDNEGCQFIYLSNKLYLPNILCYEAKTFIKERMAYQNAVVYWCQTQRMFAELFSVDICTLRESVGNEVIYIYTQKSTLPQTKTISAPLLLTRNWRTPTWLCLSVFLWQWIWSFCSSTLWWREWGGAWNQWGCLTLRILQKQEGWAWCRQLAARYRPVRWIEVC